MRKGLKWTAIAPKSQTSENAFASQRPHYFLMVGSLSSGKVEGSRDVVQGWASVSEYNSRCAAALGFRLHRVTDASSIASLEVSPADANQCSVV